MRSVSCFINYSSINELKDPVRKTVASFSDLVGKVYVT